MNRDVPILNLYDFRIGVAYKLAFPNGWGASVVRFPGTYGYEEDQWEMAVLDFDGDLIYTDDFPDVMGWLSDEQVDELINTIKGYKKWRK